MNGVSAGKKIISLLNTPDPEWGTETLDGKQRYQAGKRYVLLRRQTRRSEKREYDLPRKGMTAIVGESGCGKSTVVNMLIGAFRPQKGEVTVGGKQLEKLSRENWYSHLSAVSYNTYIFNESVRDNFKMAKENVSDEEIFAALEKVNLKEFIEENGGLDKVITEDANNISGGQKQRLALAIALVSGKDIYVSTKQRAISTSKAKPLL